VPTRPPADKPAVGRELVHEIKQDGYRLMRVEGPAADPLGNDWANRHPLNRKAVTPLKVRSFLIDGEVVLLSGLATFSTLRQAPNEAAAFLLRLTTCGS